MCFSTQTMGSAGMGLQAAGAVSQTIGAYDAANAQIKANKYQAKIAANNAQIAEYEAQDAIARGAEAERRSRLRTKQALGTNIASLAARGIDINEGSALNILTDTEYVGNQDALIIRDNAAKEAWGIRNQEGSYANNAALLRSRADAISPFGAAADTLLTSGGSVASSWYKNKLGTTGYDPAYGG